MDIFAFLRQHTASLEPPDELLYEFVAAELREDRVKQGLWTKALADSNWNESIAKANYVKARVEQLRTELVKRIHLAKRAQSLGKAALEAKEYGLTDEDIAYLGTPIKAIRYAEKYRTSREQVSEAISLGKIRGVICNEVLWVQDKPIR